MEVIPSPTNDKKWRAVFSDGTTTDFGQKGFPDFTMPKRLGGADPVRRSRYLMRHKSRENWNDPKSAGSLSRWILWGPTPDFQTNVRLFKRRFSL